LRVSLAYIQILITEIISILQLTCKYNQQVSLVDNGASFANGFIIWTSAVHFAMAAQLTAARTSNLSCKPFAEFQLTANSAFP
jgi:hypothetical protein